MSEYNKFDESEEENKTPADIPEENEASLDEQVEQILGENWDAEPLSEELEQTTVFNPLDNQEPHSSQNPLPEHAIVEDTVSANEAEQPETPDKKKIMKPHKKRRTPPLVRFVLYAALVVIIGVGAGLFAWECAQDVLALGHKDSLVTMVVTKEDTIDTLTEKLYSKGLIGHRWLFKLYCQLSHAEEKIDPGVYQLNSLYDYHALVYGMIADTGTRATATIMIPEGYDCDQIFALLEENQICSAEDLHNAASSYEFDYWFLKDLPMGESNRLEGYLYPDTYEFYISDYPENILSKMLRNFERKCDEDVQELVKNSGFSMHEIITMASIIEEEAANDDERADVSAVIHNRLASDNFLQYLQMDSTVFYACREQGGFDLQIDSPYNTYVNPGLPAGPIDNPGMPSIMAALEPAQTDNVYFATGTDGVNHFFNNHDDFEAFVNSDKYVGNAGKTE